MQLPSARGSTRSLVRHCERAKLLVSVGVHVRVPRTAPEAAPAGV